MRLARTLALSAVAAAVLTGCVTVPAPAPTPTPVAVTLPAPPGTASLADLGWRNGPTSRVLLPSGVALSRRIDQPNVVAAFGYGSEHQQVRTVLGEQLPRLGWRVTGSGPDALVFEDDQYQGTYTASERVWGLTIRVRPR